jgi:hypothetical protein
VSVVLMLMEINLHFHYMRRIVEFFFYKGCQGDLIYTINAHPHSKYTLFLLCEHQMLMLFKI